MKTSDIPHVNCASNGPHIEHTWILGYTTQSTPLIYYCEGVRAKTYEVSTAEIVTFGKVPEISKRSGISEEELYAKLEEANRFNKALLIAFNLKEVKQWTSSIF